MAELSGREASCFVPGTCPNMKSGCRRHQIGMDYLWDAIFKMATIEISVIIFSPITDSDKRLNGL